MKKKVLKFIELCIRMAAADSVTAFAESKVGQVPVKERDAFQV
jgi:hypothetical protein